MIVKYIWLTSKKAGIYNYTRTWEGWFLLGFIPLYIKTAGLKIV